MIYTIKKGHHIDRSVKALVARFYYRFLKSINVRKTHSIQFSFRILSDPYDIRPDPDQLDSSKLFGVNLNKNNPSNYDAAIVTFQSNPEKGTWDIAPYFNYDKGKFVRPNEISVKRGQDVSGEIRFIHDSLVKIKIFTDEKAIEAQYLWDKDFRKAAYILPWHGGADNNKDGTGGVAPTDIKIQLTFHCKKL